VVVTPHTPLCCCAAVCCCTAAIRRIAIGSTGSTGFPSVTCASILIFGFKNRLPVLSPIPSSATSILPAEKQKKPTTQKEKANNFHEQQWRRRSNWIKNRGSP
jgi:hypothetical protein